MLFCFTLCVQFQRMDQEKFNFITQQYIPKFKSLTADKKGKWGRMNAQQMAEHVTLFFKVSVEKLRFDLAVPEEHLPKYKEFLYSDKQFRENTKAPASVLGEDALPLRYTSMDEAVNNLQRSINEFVEFFKNNPDKKTLHPAFGELNFDEWVLLHYKHVTHHLRQFELM
jgi:hypothetical protein